MRKNTHAKLLGRYIVADPKVCHGKPTFRGTRIMVWQVLEMLADGMAWETIIEQCHNSITKDAIAEAVKLSGEAFLRHADEFVLEPTAA
jgi:uncharacterized protein (DUF433 family)